MSWIVLAVVQKEIYKFCKMLQKNNCDFLGGAFEKFSDARKGCAGIETTDVNLTVTATSTPLTHYLQFGGN